MTIFTFKMMAFCRLGFCHCAFIYAYLSARFCLHIIACALLSACYYPARCCLWTKWI